MQSSQLICPPFPVYTESFVQTGCSSSILVLVFEITTFTDIIIVLVMKYTKMVLALVNQNNTTYMVAKSADH